MTRTRTRDVPVRRDVMTTHTVSELPEFGLRFSVYTPTPSPIYKISRESCTSAPSIDISAAVARSSPAQSAPRRGCRVRARPSCSRERRETVDRKAHASSVATSASRAGTPCHTACETLCAVARSPALWRPALARFFDGELPPDLVGCANPMQSLRSQVEFARRLTDAARA